MEHWNKSKAGEFGLSYKCYSIRKNYLLYYAIWRVLVRIMWGAAVSSPAPLPPASKLKPHFNVNLSRSAFSQCFLSSHPSISEEVAVGCGGGITLPPHPTTLQVCGLFGGLFQIKPPESFFHFLKIYTTAQTWTQGWNKKNV